MNNNGCDFQIDGCLPAQLTRCQFAEESRFYECDGKQYCRFHLPAKKRDGETLTDKGQWLEDQDTDSRFAIFNEDVSCLLEVAQRQSFYDFSGVVFPVRLDLSGPNLSSIFFLGAVFETDFVATRSIFGGEANFSGAVFKGEADFEDATFDGQAKFAKATFVKKASFIGATFGGSVFFGPKTTFEGRADFTDASFKDKAIFNEGIFHSSAYFQHTGKLKSSTGQPHGERFQFLDFGDAIFEGHIDFSNRVFFQETVFDNCTFHKAPVFADCKLHENTRWLGAKFKDSSKEAADPYRFLRRAMEEKRNRQQEGLFFAREQKALRRRLPWWKLEKWLSFGYDIVAGYGRSIFRPFLAIVITAFLFCYPYSLLAGVPVGQLLDFAGRIDLLEFSAEQLVRPFAIWAKPSELAKEVFCGDISFSLKLLTALQSIATLSFLALFILALRWHFKRG